MDHRGRNMAYLFIGAGLYLAIGYMINFVSAGAMVLAALGYALTRNNAEGDRKDFSGYVLFAVAGLILFINHWGILLAVAALAVIWFFYRAKRQPGPDAPFASAAQGHAQGEMQGEAYARQHIVASIRWGGKEAWTLRSSELSVAIAEIRIDLTNAIFEEPSVVLALQGVIGDIDILVPEDVGLDVHIQAAVGEIRVAGERTSGFMNRLAWRSPNFETAEQRLRLEIAYAVADVDVKVL